MSKTESTRVIPQLSNALAFQLLQTLEDSSATHVEVISVMENGHYAFHKGNKHTTMVEVDPSSARGKELLKNGKKQEKKTLDGMYISGSKIIKEFTPRDITDKKDAILLAHKEEVALQKAAEKASKGEDNYEEMTAKALMKIAEGTTGGDSDENKKKAEQLAAKEKELEEKEMELQIKQEELDKKAEEAEKEETAEERKADLKELGIEADADGKFTFEKVSYGPELLTMPEKQFKTALKEFKAAIKAKV